MSAHTPGPWTVDVAPLSIRPTHPSRGWSIGFAPIARIVGDSRLVTQEEREANARLIAAAPDLLDIVQRLGVYLPAELQPEVNAVLAKAAQP